MGGARKLMADQNNGWLARAKAVASKLTSLSAGSGDGGLDSDLAHAEGIFNYDHVSISMLLGTGKRQARARSMIYTKYHYMMGDPIISTALRAHVTTALGGDEKSGETVFLDTTAEAEKDPKRKKLVEELKADLGPLLNRVAHQSAFNAAGFGDAYARVYVKEGEGVLDLNTDEAVYPPLVQPYSKGNQTAGYVVSTGQKFTERLSIKQMVRCKMPRMLYVAQTRVIEKAMRTRITEDDLDALPLLPDLAGGSFLEAAEEAYDNLINALTGLVGQRVLNSIDESMIGVNLEGMTQQQRKEFMSSIKGMLKSSKEYAEEAVKRARPVTERRFHIIPTFAEKQLTQISQFNGTSGASSISIEDVMFHAKMLAGALGTDLSMLGFSDILSGGLGDGGFFRTSVQAAERSRIIRTALADFFYEIVDLHTLAKYGWVFDEKDRPFEISFYGSISALEAEKQSSRERAMNSSALELTALGQLKDLNLGKDVNKQFMERSMEMDEDLAGMMAAALEKASKESADAGAGGGGFGGGGFGNEE